MSQWEDIEEQNHNEELRDSIIDEGLLNSLPLCKHDYSSQSSQSLNHQQHHLTSHEVFVSLHHKQQFAQILLENLLDRPISNEDNHFLLNILSRSNTLKKLFPRQLQLISRLPSMHDQDIEKDVERTFRDSIAFNTPQILSELKTILKCISHSLPEIGYVQGWNQLAGVLLRCQFTCEDSYWLMTYLLKKLSGKELFMGDFVLANTLDKEFEMTLQNTIPQYSDNRYFNNQQNYLRMRMFYFAFVFNNKAVRLQILIALKGWKYLIYFSLAVLSLLQGRLLQCEDEEQIDYLLKKTLRQNILGYEDKLFKDAFVIAGQLASTQQISTNTNIPIVGLDDYLRDNINKYPQRNNNNSISQQLPTSNQYYFHYHNSSIDHHSQQHYLHHQITTNSINSMQDKQQNTFDLTQSQQVAKEFQEDFAVTKGKGVLLQSNRTDCQQSDGRVNLIGKMQQILLPQEYIPSEKANIITATGHSISNSITNNPTVIPVSSIYLHNNFFNLTSGQSSTSAHSSDIPSPIPLQISTPSGGSVACKMNIDSPSTSNSNSQSKPCYSESSATTMTDHYNNNYSQKLHTPLNYPSVSLVTPFLSKANTSQQRTPLRTTQTTNNNNNNNHNHNNNSRILKSKQSTNPVYTNKITSNGNSKNNFNATTIPLSAGGQQQMNVSINTGSAKVTNNTNANTIFSVDQTITQPQEQYPSLLPQQSCKKHLSQPQFSSLDINNIDDKQSPLPQQSSSSHNRNNTTVSVSISTAGISKQSSCGNEEMLQRLQQSVKSGDARSGCENRRDWAARQEVWNLGRKQEVLVDEQSRLGKESIQKGNQQQLQYQQPNKNTSDQLERQNDSIQSSNSNNNNNNIFFTKLLSIFSPNEELSKSIHALKTEPDRLTQSFQPHRVAHYGHSISSSNELLSSKQLHTPSRILQTTSSQGDIDQIPNININRSEGEYNHDIDEEVFPNELTLSRKYSQQPQALTCKFEVRVASSKKKKNNHIQSDYSLGSMMQSQQQQQSGQQIYQSSSSKSLQYLPVEGVNHPKEPNPTITTANNPKRHIPATATASISISNLTKERISDNSLTTSLNWGNQSQNHSKIYTQRETAFQKPTTEITKVKTTSSPIKVLAIHRALSGTGNVMMGIDNSKRSQQSSKQYFSANKQKGQSQQIVLSLEQKQQIKQQPKQGYPSVHSDQSQLQLSQSVQAHKNSIQLPNSYYQQQQYYPHHNGSTSAGIKPISVSQQFQENSLLEQQQQVSSSQGYYSKIPMKMTPSSSLSMSQEFQQSNQNITVQQQQQQNQEQTKECYNSAKQGIIIEESMATTMTTTTDYNNNQHNIASFINDTTCKIDNDNNTNISNAGIQSLHLEQLRKQIAQQTYNTNSSSNNSSTCNLTNLSSSTQEMQSQQSQSQATSKSQFKRVINKNYQNYHSYTEGAKKKQLGITGSIHATTVNISPIVGTTSGISVTTSIAQQSCVNSSPPIHGIYGAIPTLDLVKSQQWTQTDKHQQLIQSTQLTDSPNQSNQDSLVSSQQQQQQSLSYYKPSLKCRRISEQMNPQLTLLQSQQLTKRSTLGDIMHHQHHYTNNNNNNTTSLTTGQSQNNQLSMKNLATDKDSMIVSELFKQQQTQAASEQMNNTIINKQLNLYQHHSKNSSIAISGSQREGSVSKRQAMNELIKTQKEQQQQMNSDLQSKSRQIEETQQQFKLQQSQQLLKTSSQLSYQQWKQQDGSRKGSQHIKIPPRMLTEPTYETTIVSPEIASKDKQMRSQYQYQQQQSQQKEQLNQISSGKGNNVCVTNTPHGFVQHRS